MPKSPFLKKSKISKDITLENRRKQKFAIWDYYKNKNCDKKTKFSNEK